LLRNLNKHYLRINSNSGQLVQKECFDKLKKRIDSHMDSLVDAKSDTGKNVPEPAGSGLVCFIDGTRGAGKSTFLRSVYKHFEATGKSQNNDKGICALAYIDPSRIARNEIPLLGILQALRKKAESQIRCCDSENDERGTLDKFQSAFRKLAGGLALLDPKHEPMNGMDPELYLDSSLESAKDSAGLREQLHILFESACALFGVKALLITFDDADTDAANAYKVLECIRTYLDSRRVITLVTGDMGLYSIIVKNKFKKELEFERKDYDVSASPNDLETKGRSDMLDHLREQYLLKLFPIQNRFRLLPILSLEQNKAKGPFKDIFMIKLAQGESGSLRNALEVLLKECMGVGGTDDIKTYQEFILGQPLRTIMQLLARCQNDLGIKDKNASDTPTEFYVKDVNELSNSFRAAVLDMALVSLSKNSIEADEIARQELHFLTHAIYQLQIRSGASDDSANLLPIAKDDDQNKGLIMVAAEVAAHSKQSVANLLQLMLKGLGSVDIMQRVRDLKTLHATNVEESLGLYMGVGSKTNCCNWGQHATSLIAEPQKSGGSLISCGVVCLNERHKKNYKKPTFMPYKEHWKSKGEDLPPFAYSVVKLTGNAGGRGTSFASIFIILGLVEALLTDFVRFEDKSDVRRVLNKSYEATISRFGFVGPNGKDDDVEDGEEDKTSTDPKNITSTDPVKDKASPLVKALESWRAQAAPQVVNPSAALMGKIWKRLYISLENAGEDLSSKYNAAEIMEMYAVCVINAFLVEEVNEYSAVNGGNIKIEQVNPRTSAQNFFDRKLKNLGVPIEELPLTLTIATCPLITGLINPSSGGIETLYELLPEDRKGMFYKCPEADFKAVGNFLIAGRNYGKKPDKNEKPDKPDSAEPTASVPE